MLSSPNEKDQKTLLSFISTIPPGQQDIIQIASGLEETDELQQQKEPDGLDPMKIDTHFDRKHSASQEEACKTSMISEAKAIQNQISNENFKNQLYKRKLIQSTNHFFFPTWLNNFEETKDNLSEDPGYIMEESNAPTLELAQERLKEIRDPRRRALDTKRKWEKWIKGARGKEPSEQQMDDYLSKAKKKD
ncbi:hypothetical protein Salat_1176500 [Sesamum alatum]|uniref:Uncharacterized protein n=1 Tax=Sesamum alatum TaxID=300844 RepID=A0AAE2CNL0_9LAMI|nr:hypothetical protein Salat_1176500 [Sesamum alatum]